MTKTLKNHTLQGRTYLYSPYKVVPPSRGGGGGVSAHCLWLLVVFLVYNGKRLEIYAIGPKSKESVCHLFHFSAVHQLSRIGRLLVVNIYQKSTLANASASEKDMSSGHRGNKNVTPYMCVTHHSLNIRLLFCMRFTYVVIS